MGSEVAARADFSGVRYAQCWEDADILLEGLDVRPGQVVVSIASAGDNALALLSRGPERVIALDLSPAQLACLELRVAAYRTLSHPELLELVGSTKPTDSRPWAWAPHDEKRDEHRSRGEDRLALYHRCRPLLSPSARDFWDQHPEEIRHGIGGAGKFERYFATFRRWLLPLVHGRKTIDALLRGGTPAECAAFYTHTWNTWRWRTLFRVFFSRFVMGRLGRDPSFFRYVEGSVSDRILERTRHALTALNPADNPYLQWILTGRHTTALPFALRPENFDAIRANLDRLEWHAAPLEDFLDRLGPAAVDAYNLSDIFEYMSEPNCHKLLEKLAHTGRPGARLAYWNMLAPRSGPEHLADRLRPLPELAARLHLADKAFFYSKFVVEEVC